MVQQALFGFTLKETKELKDIHSTAYLYEHDKTKASVLYLKNTDTNKAFNIAFATPPYDDNGIAHIIEHSVLNGSKKYPTKEPFVELLKGSLNTFLNAMTYSDKTVYPVASCNEKDFENLMSVYLDAVFSPLFYENPQILMQEGWHYHLEHADDELIYKGVVYNEMRGAYSQAESELFRLIEPSLYPDTIYRHNSGGMPESIPTLTQEKFIDFHQTYYHPSNAKVTLYGDLDIEAAMKQLATYFDAYEYREYSALEVAQTPFDEVKHITSYYPVASGETTENKSLLAYVWSIDTSLNGELAVAFAVLDEILLSKNTSPLKRALLQSGLGADVMGGYLAYSYQPFFDVTLKDTNSESKEEFERIIKETLTELVREGIPTKLVEASLNKVAFRLKEATSLEGSTPKGVEYALNSLTSWLYGGSPYEHIEFSKHLETFYAQMNNRYFENLIQTYLLDNTHAVVIDLAPKEKLGEEREEALACKLRAYKESLSQEEIDELVSMTQALIERQETPDTPEQLKTLPRLSKADIQPDAKELVLQVEEQGRQLFYEDFTSGIGYAAWYFNMDKVPIEYVPYAAFLAEVLGELETTAYSPEELATEIDFYTGGVSTNTTVITESVEENIYYPKFVVSGKVLQQYTSDLIRIVSEIVTQTKWDNHSKVKELLLKTKSGLEMNMNHAAHAAALSRVRSYYSQAAKYEQAIDGVDYYDFVEEQVRLFDEQAEVFIERLQQTMRYIFTKENVVTTFTGSREDYERFVEWNQQLIEQLSDEVFPVQSFTTLVEVLNEGFKTAQEVQYVAKGYNLALLGESFDGSGFVLQKVLGLDYLWNTVRVKGGAYGGMSVVTDLGDIGSVSYRDPNLKETLKVYDRTADYLREFNPSNEEFEKYIIGTFSTIDRPLSATQKGAVAVRRYFTHVTHEDVQNKRSQILATTKEQIQAYAPLFEQIAEKNMLAVIGNAGKIDSQAHLFKNVRYLTK